MVGIFKTDLLAFLSGINSLEIALMVVCAFLAGHLFADLSFWFVYRLFKRQGWRARGLQAVSERYPQFNHQFKVEEWGLLFSILQERNPQYVYTLNVFESNSIMLANISLGLLALAILQIVNLVEGFTATKLVVLISELILLYLARKRSQMLHSWYYLETFEASLAYGNSAEEVVAYGKEQKASPPNKTRKVKSERK